MSFKKIILMGFLLCLHVFLHADKANAGINEAIQKVIEKTKNNSYANQIKNKTGDSNASDQKSIEDIPLDNPSIEPKKATKHKSSNEKTEVVRKTDYFNTPIPKGATKIDLDASVDIKIIEGKYGILDFPFNITTVDFDDFKSNITKEINEPLEKSSDDNDTSPIRIDQKDNRLVIYSKVTGKTQMVVWGGDFPVIVNTAVNKQDGKTYYKFISKQKSINNEAVKKLESNNHERIINILNVALYKNETPRGYERIDKKGDFTLKKQKIRLLRDYGLIGRYYVAEKWNLINMDKDNPLNLYETMFYGEDIYSVALLNDRLDPLKSTSIYIIRRNHHPK